MTEIQESHNTDRKSMVGLFGPLVAVAAILTAIALSPWFTWEGNALSDLGRYANGLPAAIVFDAGLVLTGVMMLLFTIWFIQKVSDVFTKIGLVPYVVATIFLTLIGVFSEDFGHIHFIVSVGFFASFPFAMWMVGIGFLRYSHLRWFSVVSIILPFFSLYVWVGYYGGLFPFLTGVAIPEFTTALTAIAWVWILLLLEHKNKLSMIMKPS